MTRNDFEYTVVQRLGIFNAIKLLHKSKLMKLACAIKNFLICSYHSVKSNQIKLNIKTDSTIELIESTKFLIVYVLMIMITMDHFWF